MIKDIIITFLVCFALPVGIVWIVTRARMQKTKLTSDILLAAIEKNSSVDIDGIAKSLGKRGKERMLTPMERNLRNLQIGCSTLIIGIGFGLFYYLGPGAGKGCIYTAIILVGIGIGALVAYFIGKHSLKD